MNNNIMIDLETLDTSPNAAVLSIALVRFDPEIQEIGEEYYNVLRLQDNLDLNRSINAETLDFWLEQTLSRNSTLSTSCRMSPNVSMERRLARVGAFIKDDDLLWGNGTDFDNVILSSLFRDVFGKHNNYDSDFISKKFRNFRCFRTLKNLFPEITLEFEGTKHVALDDAIHQAKHCMKILKHIEELKSHPWQGLKFKDFLLRVQRIL